MSKDFPANILLHALGVSVKTGKNVRLIMEIINEDQTSRESCTVDTHPTGEQYVVFSDGARARIEFFENGAQVCQVRCADAEVGEVMDKLPDMIAEMDKEKDGIMPDGTEV